jgi:predicted MFS family arabinose efflux permease
MVGAIFVQYASWRWIFWLIAMIALPIAAACIYLIPTTPSHADSKISQLDFVGVSTLTGSSFLAAIT